jgi:hypothetical protein
MDDLGGDRSVPAVPGIRGIGWLVLEATRFVGGHAREMKLRRITQSPPSLTGTEVAIKLTVQVPVSVFDRGIASIRIDVPEELISQPDVTVEAAV